MDFFPSVQAHHDIVHLGIAEFHDLIIQQNTVGRDRETEMLVCSLLQLSSVCNQVLDDLEVHERLSAEEVNFQIPSVAGIGNKEIQRLFADFEGHQGTSAVIFSFFSKAVLTCKITVVRNVQTECLDNRLTFSEIKDCAVVDILGKQLALFLQGPYFFERFPDIIFGILCGICLDYRLIAAGRILLYCINYVIDQIVDNMYASAVDIQYDIISVAAVLMNQSCLQSSIEQAAAGALCDSLSNCISTSKFQINRCRIEGSLLLFTGLIADRAAGLAC